MKLSLIGSAVTEEQHHHSIAALKLGGQCCTSRNRQTGSDNTVRPQHPDAEIGDMHRAAFSLAVAGFSAIYLRHHAVKVSTFGDTVPVTPVIADNTVIRPQIGADAGSHRLLADVGVHYTGYSPASVINNHPLLKSPDGQHHLI